MRHGRRILDELGMTNMGVSRVGARGLRTENEDKVALESCAARLHWEGKCSSSQV
mgnify:CR=1 FL=1